MKNKPAWARGSGLLLAAVAAAMLLPYGRAIPQTTPTGYRYCMGLYAVWDDTCWGNPNNGWNPPTYATPQEVCEADVEGWRASRPDLTWYVKYFPGPTYAPGRGGARWAIASAGPAPPPVTGSTGWWLHA